MKRDNDPSGPKEALYNWYPGHMAKALREIKQKMEMVDLVLEIRDARVPLASGNDAMAEALGTKPRLIILNKENLADPQIVALWKTWFEKEKMAAVFVNCFEKPAVKKIMAQAKKMVEQNRERTVQQKLKLMIVGLPNTGKSTVINQLANKSAAKVADKPGVTKNQQWITVDKETQLLDTPGIMPPKIEKAEHALWLSAIHAIPDDIADEETTATFVVKHLLKNESAEFLKKFKLPSFELSPEEAMKKIAILRGCVMQGGVPDLNRVYKLVLSEFREGELGRTSFGLPPTN